MTRPIRLLRGVGVVLGNLFTALIGTAILESELWHIVPTKAISTVVAKGYFFSTLIPFVLGYCVFWKWRYRSAKWIWIAGLFSIGIRAVSYWMSEASFRLLAVNHSVFEEMSGVGCNNGIWSGCIDFLTYTVPFVRTLFYSAGAWCCSVYRLSPMDLQRLIFWHKSQSQGHEVLGQYLLNETQEGDRMVIEQLQQNGADLSKPRDVRHYLYVPTAQDAAQAATDLRSWGYETEERMSSDADQNPPNPFLVLAWSERVVSIESVEEMRRRFERLALDHGGEYDGWEAAAED